MCENDPVLGVMVLRWALSTRVRDEVCHRRIRESNCLTRQAQVATWDLRRRRASELPPGSAQWPGAQRDATGWRPSPELVMDRKLCGWLPSSGRCATDPINGS